MSTKLLTASLLALLLILQPCSATYNVHFTFHSHDDVGWLNTADEYYTGTSNGYPFTASVKNTLDQARSALNLNSKRIFIPVEMYFFRKWYNALDSTGKANVRDLIKNNQFQITNGGWVMNDEGAAYYEDIIDQFTLGHRFTYKEFGVIPKIGWHIDPFGHSGGQVNIFGQMGFDAWFFERIDYQEMSQKKQNGNLEFMWTPKTALGELNSMFSHINYQKYVNYPMRTGLSPSQLKDSFKTFLDGATKGFKSQTIFHHAGDDFVIISDSDYKEIETMIASFNSDSSSNFKISISSPQMYIDDLYSQARSGKFNISALETKTDDDFFPYEDVAGAYWTGYFTSRPYLKYMIRESGRMLRNTQKFVSLMSLPQQTMKTSYSTILKKFQDTLFPLYDALAMGQHHDAITGTARTNVNRDYLQRISNGLSAATTYLNDVVNNLKDTTNSVTCAMSHNYDVPLNDNCKTFYTALFSITTQPSVTARVLVFNPRASDAALVRFWVQKYVHTVSVVANGVTQEVASSMVCDLQAFSFASDAYTTAPCQLFVEVSVGAYSTVEFVITAKRGSEEVTQLSGSALNANGTVVIDSTTSIGLSANSSTFQLTSGSESYSFAISYQVYPIGYGSVNSGAYLLKTSSTTKSPYNVFSSMKSYNSSSFVLIEMISDVSQATKVSALLIFHKNYVSSKGIHIISTIPAMPSTGEMVLNIKVNGFTNSQNAFHTDMNGYEMIKRVIGYRKSGVQIQDSISGNYYPMYSAMYTDDDGSSKRMLLMTDRTQSVSSFEPGQVEVLLQRRAQADDERGVAETYVDSTSVITHHYLFFGSTSHLDIIQRQKQVEIDQPFLVLAGSVSTSSSNPSQLFPYLQSNITSRIAQTQCETASRSTLKLNFEPLDTAGEYLLKVQNLHPTASTSVTLKSISESTSSLLECAIGLQTQSISKLTVTDMTEMTITGVEKLTDMLARRKYWKCTESDATKCQEQLQNSVFAYTENTTNTKIATLLPMQMRVFKFTVNPEGLSDTTVAPPMATGAVHLVGFVALWSYIIGAILVGL